MGVELGFVEVRMEGAEAAATEAAIAASAVARNVTLCAV
jgi:hypothetical protein